MPLAATIVETARREIRTVLRRYRLRWKDIAPDVDSAIWRKIAPTARKTRRALFRERYKSLSAATPSRKYR